MSNILGILAFYHDSAACFVRDGEIVAAAQEERFTRKKHYAGFQGRKTRRVAVAGRAGTAMSCGSSVDGELALERDP